jgi:hypothetical protein
MVLLRAFGVSKPGGEKKIYNLRILTIIVTSFI